MRWIFGSEIVDIRVEILDKHEQSTVNTGSYFLEFRFILGRAYLQILEETGEKCPKPVKKARKAAKTRESSSSIQRKYFRAAVKVVPYSVSLRPIIVDIRERHYG